jgi:hypothetical protein
MGTNRVILNKGIKYMAWALPMFFIGPSVIYNAFQNQDTYWHYLVLVVGVLICFGSIYFTFKGINTIVKSMFGN